MYLLHDIFKVKLHIKHYTFSTANKKLNLKNKEKICASRYVRELNWNITSVFFLRRNGLFAIFTEDAAKIIIIKIKTNM